MSNEQIKAAAPWLGIPVLCLVYLLLNLDRIAPTVLLQDETLILLGYVAALWDIRLKRVPNQLVLIVLGAWVLIMFPQLLLHPQHAIERLVDGLLGFAMAGALFLLVYWISRKGLGGGDVKFMAVAGLYLGLTNVLTAMLCGSVLSALVALTLLVTKKIGRKDTMPLIPFLYAGMLIALFFQ